MPPGLFFSLTNTPNFFCKLSGDIGDPLMWAPDRVKVGQSTRERTPQLILVQGEGYNPRYLILAALNYSDFVPWKNVSSP